MDNSEQRMVRVACGIPGGVDLVVFGDGHDDGSGTMRRRGVESFHLQGPSGIDCGTNAPTGTGGAIENAVPADLWDRWRGQYKHGHPWISSGMIGLMDEKAAEPKAEEADHDDGRL